MSHTLFPSRADSPPREKHLQFLRESIKIARRALQNGRHPFGCILVSEDGEILFTQGNIDTLNHAEATLCRTAWTNLAPPELWKCTLYTNFEPCAMCAGSIYWANIGTIVYGCTEEKLLSLTGDDAENMTLNLSCRQLFKSGQKDVRVFGPFDEIEDEVSLQIQVANIRSWQITLPSGRAQRTRNQLKKWQKNNRFENSKSNQKLLSIYYSSLFCQESRNLMISVNAPALEQRTSLFSQSRIPGTFVMNIPQRTLGSISFPYKDGIRFVSSLEHEETDGIRLG